MVELIVEVLEEDLGMMAREVHHPSSRAGCHTPDVILHISTCPEYAHCVHVPAVEYVTGKQASLL